MFCHLDNRHCNGVIFSTLGAYPRALDRGVDIACKLMGYSKRSLTSSRQVHCTHAEKGNWITYSNNCHMMTSILVLVGQYVVAWRVLNFCSLSE